MVAAQRIHPLKSEGFLRRWRGKWRRRRWKPIHQHAEQLIKLLLLDFSLEWTCIISLSPSLSSPVLSSYLKSFIFDTFFPPPLRFVAAEKPFLSAEKKTSSSENLKVRTESKFRTRKHNKAVWNANRLCRGVMLMPREWEKLVRSEIFSALKPSESINFITSPGRGHGWDCINESFFFLLLRRP